MNIIWVADFFKEDRNGGAQLTNDIIINHGQKRGFNISTISAKHYNTTNLPDNSLYIINNFCILYRQAPKLIDHIIKTKHYIRFVHDYDWIYPHLKESLLIKMFENSMLNIFLSPLHFQGYKKTFPSIKNATLVPSPINLDMFYDREKPRKKNSVIYAGEFGSHKGLNHIINFALFHPELTFDLYGWVDNSSYVQSTFSELPTNINIFDPLPYDQLPDLYNRYQFAIHLPIWHEPFGRFVAEAYFSGCKLITNSNRVGFMSYLKKFTNKEKLAALIESAPELFWLKIKNVYDRI